MVYLQDRVLDPKKSIRDFELFVAGSFYHSDLSPLLPISILSHSSKPLPPGFQHHISNSSLESSKQFCPCSIRTSTPTPCPISNQLLLQASAFFFFLRVAPAAHGSPQARGGIGAAAAGLYHGHCNAAQIQAESTMEYHSWWQRWIFNPLREAKDHTCILTDTMSGS